MIKTLHSRKGSAIVVSLCIVVILLISEFFLMHQTSSNIRFREKNIGNLRAWFAVRSALQHALLKHQFMPTQLYDAVAFSAGKNPLFDFTEYKQQPIEIFPSIEINGTYLKLASDLNPGPRFVTTYPGTVPSNTFEKMTKIDKFHSECMVKGKAVNPWPKDYKGNDIYNPSLYLWKYYSDIKFNSNDFKEINYPYKVSYAVTDLKVASMQEQRKYMEEVVEISAIGTIVFKNSDYSKNITTLVRVKRDG